MTVLQSDILEVAQILSDLNDQYCTESMQQPLFSMHTDMCDFSITAHVSDCEILLYTSANDCRLWDTEHTQESWIDMIYRRFNEEREQLIAFRL